MNKHYCSVFVVAALSLLFIPPAFCAPKGELIEEKIDGVTVLVYVPGNYDPAKKKYPLIVGCHGADNRERRYTSPGAGEPNISTTTSATS